MQEIVLKETDDIKRVKQYLKDRGDNSYYVFLIAINTGIPVSEIVNFTFDDVQVNGKIINSILISNIDYCIATSLRNVLQKLIEKQDWDSSQYLFKNKRGNNRLDRSQFYRILKKTFMELKIDICSGNDVCRRTFGYHYYQQTSDMGYLKNIFHKSKSEIIEYIGINTKKNIENFEL